MVLIGLSWLIYFLLVEVFSLDTIKAALVTAIIFILLGFIVGERPWVIHRD